MFVDTHCHLNMIVKDQFDVPLTNHNLALIKPILEQAQQKNVKQILNVGTSLVESLNCIEIAKRFDAVWAVIGIHPNDLTTAWRDDLSQLRKLILAENKVVGIGECGLDFHYPDFRKEQQIDAFKAQIELALEMQLPISVHTRDASEETLRVLEPYRANGLRGIIHCFSEKLDFAQIVNEWGFVLGIGGTITYPKNEFLREVVVKTDLSKIVLETDAPFLPIQKMRGKKNFPEYIYDIAVYVAELKNTSLEAVAEQTSENVNQIFKLSGNR